MLGWSLQGSYENLVLETKVDVSMTTSDDSILELHHERYRHQDEQHTTSITERKHNVKVKADAKLCEACVR